MTRLSLRRCDVVFWVSCPILSFSSTTLVDARVGSSLASALGPFLPAGFLSTRDLERRSVLQLGILVLRAQGERPRIVRLVRIVLVVALVLGRAPSLFVRPARRFQVPNSAISLAADERVDAWVVTKVGSLRRRGEIAGRPAQQLIATQVDSIGVLATRRIHTPPPIIHVAAAAPPRPVCGIFARARGLSGDPKKTSPLTEVTRRAPRRRRDSARCASPGTPPRRAPGPRRGPPRPRRPPARSSQRATTARAPRRATTARGP